MIPDYREGAQRFARFIIVGGAAAAGYFTLLKIALDLFGLNYRLGVSVAYILAIIGHFLGSRWITFRTKDDVYRQIPRYLVLAGANYLLTIGIVWLAVEFFSINVLWAALAAWVVTTLVGFVLASNWVFQREQIKADG